MGLPSHISALSCGQDGDLASCFSLDERTLLACVTGFEGGETDTFRTKRHKIEASMCSRHGLLEEAVL